MQLYNNTFDSFSNANYIINSLNKAINTSYIPTGDNLQEVINNFTKIQLQRSFDPNGCYSQANLEMVFNERNLCIDYGSTSCTSVQVRYYFNNKMEVEKIDISVWLPDDRAKSGRYHYECLTEALYRYDFLKIDWENNNTQIQFPPNLDKLNNDADWTLTNNIPKWVFEQESNYHAAWNPIQVDNDLASLGYEKVSDPIGYKAAYHNLNHYYQYVVVYERYNQCDNNYYLLQDADDKLYIDQGGLSYKRLLELIESTKDKEQRQSRRSRRNCITVIEQEEVEDYDYDEK